MKKEDPNEGARGFAWSLKQIDDEVFEADCSTEQQILIGKLSHQAGQQFRDVKGELVVKLTYVMSPNGTVRVLGEIASKPPKVARAGSTFWVTPGNNLSTKNPRQMDLPLREVPVAAKAQDVPVAPTAVHDV